MHATATSLAAADAKQPYHHRYHPVLNDISYVTSIDEDPLRPPSLPFLHSESKTTTLNDAQEVHYMKGTDHVASPLSSIVSSSIGAVCKARNLTQSKASAFAVAFNISSKDSRILCTVERESISP